MPARPIIGLIKVVGVVSYFLAAYLIIMWVTASFAITYNGPVRWSSGWDYTVEHIQSAVGWTEDEGCVEPHYNDCPQMVYDLTNPQGG